jgi:hypothetical protein
VNLVGGLLKQLLATLPDLPKDLVEIYRQKAERDRQSLELSDAIAIFSSICKTFKRTYICLDALDECKDVIQLLKSLQNLSSSVFFFMTSRRHLQVCIQGHFKETLAIPIVVSENDIRAYIKDKVDGNRTEEPEIMDDKLKGEITDKIVTSSGGMSVTLLSAYLIQTYNRITGFSYPRSIFVLSSKREPSRKGGQP